MARNQKIVSSPRHHIQVVELSKADAPALATRLAKVLTRPWSVAECCYLFAEDLNEIWPGKFNGDFKRAAAALQNAGFKSARATVAG